MASQQIQITLADILPQVHAKYGKLIAALMQENAEQQAGIEVLGPRIDELEQENAVLRAQFNQMSNGPAAGVDIAAPSGGSGLLGASGQVIQSGVPPFGDA